jgi:flagellar biosynthesis anti-sigma factor FlgM
MKINQQQPKVPIQEKSVNRGHEKDTGKADGNPSAKSSVLAKGSGNFTVNKVRDRIDAAPDIDAERVTALKARIKNGEYQIDNLKLANRILKNSILEDR